MGRSHYPDRLARGNVNSLFAGSQEPEARLPDGWSIGIPRDHHVAHVPGPLRRLSFNGQIPGSDLRLPRPGASRRDIEGASLARFLPATCLIQPEAQASPGNPVRAGFNRCPRRRFDTQSAEMRLTLAVRVCNHAHQFKCFNGVEACADTGFTAAARRGQRV